MARLTSPEELKSCRQEIVSGRDPNTPCVSICAGAGCIATGADEVIEAFRERADEAGSGYQTMINEALRQYLSKSSKPLDEASLRKILREELQSAS